MTAATMVQPQFCVGGGGTSSSNAADVLGQEQGLARPPSGLEAGAAGPLALMPVAVWAAHVWSRLRPRDRASFRACCKVRVGERGASRGVPCVGTKPAPTCTPCLTLTARSRIGTDRCSAFFALPVLVPPAAAKP